VLEQIGNGKCPVVLCDINMQALDGLNFLQQALQHDPGVYVILISDGYSIELAVEAIKRGAYDYISKPVDRSRLSRTLSDLDEQFHRRRRIHELERQLVSDLEFHGIVGRSPVMIEVFELARKIARHYTGILLTGASGTGKELIAHAIHQMGPNANRRFAVCNCFAVADTLLESQLFGHARGAFPGAMDSRPGLFELASGGTIFLDEVGEMSLQLQAKLLRFIETREIQRVGSSEFRHVDVRLIASTNRDLHAEVSGGRFRDDLLHRLSTVHIHVPSLVERLDDLPLIVAFFLKKYNKAYNKHVLGLTRRAQTALLQQAWPGNVRELENVVSSAALVTANDFIDLDDLPEHLRKALVSGLSSESWKPLPLDEVRQEHIQRVLALCHGNRVRTAQLLGIGRTSLYRYLKREGINNKGARAHAI
jgi:DNA-binding NtrC family response regulator